MKKVLACLLALVMVGSISGCSSVNKVDTFDEACELIDEIKEVNGREEIELERQISNLLSELGLHTSGEATYSKYYKDEKEEFGYIDTCYDKEPNAAICVDMDILKFKYDLFDAFEETERVINTKK